MNNYLKMIGVLTLATTIYACDNGENEAPAGAKTKLKEQFPSAENIRWEEKNENLYTVKFNDPQEGEFMSEYSKTGEWLKTNHFLTKDLAPKDLLIYADSVYAGNQLETISLMTKPKFEGYELELKHDGTIVEMVFDINGKFISTKKE